MLQLFVLIVFFVVVSADLYILFYCFLSLLLYQLISPSHDPVSPLSAGSSCIVSHHASTLTMRRHHYAQIALRARVPTRLICLHAALSPSPGKCRVHDE